MYTIFNMLITCLFQAVYMYCIEQINEYHTGKIFLCESGVKESIKVECSV
jgi:hypothetical protein